MVQWLRLCTHNAGGPGSIPGQGTRCHMLQLRVHMPRPEIPRATTKTWQSQINEEMSPIHAQSIFFHPLYFL